MSVHKVGVTLKASIYRLAQIFFCFPSRSTLGPTLEQISFTDDQILKQQDHTRQQAMHLMQLAVFVVYSIHIKSEQWLPFFKIVMNKKCNPLWMWSEDELKDLQDKELIKTVIVLKEVVSQLAANIAPKLNSFGLFAGSDIEPDTLVRYMASHHITSHHKCQYI